MLLTNDARAPCIDRSGRIDLQCCTQTAAGLSSTSKEALGEHQTTYISSGDADLYVYQGDPWTYPSELNLVGRSVNGGTTNEAVWIPGPGTYYAQVYIFRVDNNGYPVHFNISW